MTDQNTDEKRDKRLVAREHRHELDEVVTILEFQGWTVDQDVEPNPYRPNPSCPPWPTIQMSRPVEHPQAAEDWRERAIKLQNTIGEIQENLAELLADYLVLARFLDLDTFVNRGGGVEIRGSRISEEDTGGTDRYAEVRQVIQANRKRWGPK